MKKIKIILILCFFSLSLFCQTKIVTIRKGTVFWERTIPKKEYKKYLKTGEINIIKSKISSIAHQKAEMQGSSVVSIINSVSSFDETNPESAIDAIYNETISYNQIEWIEGPYEMFEEITVSKFGKKAMIIRCSVYGKLKKTIIKPLPDNKHFISIVLKNKQARENKIVLEKQTEANRIAYKKEEAEWDRINKREQRKEKFNNFLFTTAIIVGATFLVVALML